MGLGTLNKTISLLTRLIDDKTTTEPILEFSPQKPSLPKAPVSSPLPRTSPESVGISSAYIAEFLTALELDKSLMSLGGEGVVFARRSRLALLPFIFEDTVLLETIEQGIEGTFHDYHVGLTELLNDVVSITCALFQ